MDSMLVMITTCNYKPLKSQQLHGVNFFSATYGCAIHVKCGRNPLSEQRIKSKETCMKKRSIVLAMIKQQDIKPFTNTQ